MASKKNPASGIIGSGRYAKLNALKKDPVAHALITKLVTESGTTVRAGRRRNDPPAEGLARRISDQTTQNINDTSNIFQLLPDTELAMQIMVSSILSPKDMINVELGYRVDQREIESEVAGAMIDVVRRYFEESYKIKSLLPKILEDVLFMKGSYPLLVLPESTIDHIINGDSGVSLESLRGELHEGKYPRRSIGLLGHPTRQTATWSLETMFSRSQPVGDSDCLVRYGDTDHLRQALKGDLVITDNPNALKFPQLVEKMRKNRLSDAIDKAGFGVRGVSLEARKRAKGDEVSDEELERHLYKPRPFSYTPYLSVKPGSSLARPSVGHPVVMKLPPEAVIPVHVPANPEEHIGYFILLDQFGNPLNRARESDYYRDLSSNISSSNMTSQLLEAGRRAAQGQYGAAGRTTSMTEAETVRLYADIVERDLLARLKNGVYGENVEIARPLDVYRVMLARSLASMGTQILYVPVEMVTYIAFTYNQWGVGKSLLEDNKILASIRAMLMFSNTMAAIRNSTGKTAVKIELDENDPDPSSTVEYMIHEYSRNRQAAYPLGASNPLDIIDFLQNAGIDVQVSGNPGYPETRMEVEDHATSKVEVDSALDEDIKRKYFMSLGLSPETIDMSSNVEFATSVVTSNLLLAKRVIIYQDSLLAHLKDFIVKFTQNSSLLWEELIETCTSNKKLLGNDNRKLAPEELVEKFLRSLELTLPRPDSAKLENQMMAFNAYREALEVAVDAYLGADGFVLKEFDDIEENIGTVRAAIIAHYQREWLRNNNVLPELMEIVLQDDNGNPEFNLADVHGAHVEMVGRSIVDLLKRLHKDRKKREKALAKLEENSDQDVGGDEGYDTYSGDDDEGPEEEEVEANEEPEESEASEEEEETPTEEEETEEPDEEPETEVTDEETEE